MVQKRQAQSTGQATVFGEIQGLDKLVNKPTVITYDGMKVVQLVIPEYENETPGYVDEALKLARKLQPEVKSKGRPPWLTAEWHKKRRMRKAGL